MIHVVKSFGLPVVVAVNSFPTDTPEEVVIMQHLAIEAGAAAAVTCTGFAEGGAGAANLAEAVVRATDAPTPRIKYLYPLNAPIREKVRALATKVYNAADVRWSPPQAARPTVSSSKGWATCPCAWPRRTRRSRTTRT